MQTLNIISNYLFLAFFLGVVLYMIFSSISKYKHPIRKLTSKNIPCDKEFFILIDKISKVENITDFMNCDNDRKWFLVNYKEFHTLEQADELLYQLKCMKDNI